MSSQPTPSVDAQDVERIARRDYGPESSLALSVLQEYGAETWHREVDRVRLAVLKLGAGDIAALRSAMEMALKDYRDVLAVAEYPGYDKLVRPSAELSEDERQRIIHADWKQYSTWLKGTG